MTYIYNYNIIRGVHIIIFSNPWFFSILDEFSAMSWELRAVEACLIIWGHRAGYIGGPFRIPFRLPEAGLPTGSIFQLYSICVEELDYINAKRA